MAFAPISRGSALPRPPATGRLSNDAAGFASCYGPHRRSPCRASDAGLRPGPFPGRAASLLPGLLAATRTGLPPAGDDELTNSKIRCYVTASPPALLGARTRLIADLTGANPNVMYELGLRHTRNMLTVQIGEYGRLPFDVNVIRTVQFSRSTYGLITARNELIQMLEAGLTGEYDMVTATRIWNEHPVAEAPPDEHEHGEQPVEAEAPGFMDLIADSEENQQALNNAVQAVGERLAELGSGAETATQRMAASDAQGAGMRGRLAVTREYAEEMNRIAEQLEDDVNKYEAAMRSVSAGTLAIIQRLEEDPAQLPDAMDFGRVLRQTAARTRQALESQQGFVASMNEAARATQVMRGPARRVSNALDRFASASQAVDEWDRRLQALGVDVPPEGWQHPDSGTQSHA
jgi:hypothetical protein